MNAFAIEVIMVSIVKMALACYLTALKTHAKLE